MKTRFEGFQPIRHDRLIQEYRHDTYKSRLKLPEPTACPQCGAVFHDGRWQWAPRPAQAHEEMCPACHRIHDEFPAGFVTVGGAFFREHRDELLHLVKNEEARAKAEHALERIIKIEEQDDGVMITTTGTHLARGIGEALHHAYQGELEFHYNPDENLLRVHWAR
ncbi:MAG TPA: BCAM0308 family protein [Sulfuricella sp.]|nr:BCAM0308 family protein [Sulfuricella sp.]